MYNNIEKKIVMIEQPELIKCRNSEPFTVGVFKKGKPKVPPWFQDFLDNRFSRVETDIANLKIDVKRIDNRLDDIETRLDQNNLKPLIKNSK